jgi:crotonobetainyl-CoA:carnitine CoA-transferase CaiB-like acyl-CoA transferase
MLPLSGLKVLDFSTLLPGPLATLMLAEAGAEVVKVERPGTGDDMRRYQPFTESDNPNFALLNRGKASISADLRDPAQKNAVLEMVRHSDIIVEQFRPGVMKRLGLDFDSVRKVNPRIIYCSITGYGQTGTRALVAAHDLNYVGEAGLLALGSDRRGVPIVPSAQVADIGGGTLPAVVNILLALRQVEQSGQGMWLDVSMTDNLMCWQSWALGQGEGGGMWPRSGKEPVSGGSPRYQVYATADGRFLAAAPLEDRFWKNFCEAIALDPKWHDDRRDLEGTIDAVAHIIGAQTSEHWQRHLAGKDVCCSIVATLKEARYSRYFAERRLFDRKVTFGGGTIAALPMPISRHFLRTETVLPYPEASTPIGVVKDKETE